VGTRLQEEETDVKCVICKNGETKPGKVTVTLERGSMTLVVKAVPAEVCSNCGEEYVDEETTARLLQTAEEADRLGVQVDVREYLAA
jgi:YgiT-type zinc finger domain-containing protein